MNIIPTTAVYILKDVPLKPDYRHTIYFTNQSDQFNYFHDTNKILYKMLDHTYQRAGVNRIRVQISADNLYNANYMKFMNQRFNNKWFYAFIKSVNYVNENCSEIEYEIDVLQTWHFDYTLKECFVEREHVTNDTIGRHTVEESFQIGEYMYSTGNTDQHFRNWGIVVAATIKNDSSLSPATGGMYGGVYSGLVYNTFIGNNKAANVNNFLNALTTDNKAGAVVSIFMIPEDFIVGADATGISQYDISFNKDINNAFRDPDGTVYTPRNKKLYCYPYNFLTVSDNNGRAAQYRYEDFKGVQCEFKLKGVMSCNPEFSLTPKNYLNVAENVNYRMCITDMPQCAYNTDTFAAWLAQNKASLTIGAVGTGVSAAAHLATANIGGLVQDAFSIADKIADYKVHEALPPQAKGQQSSTINIASGVQGYTYYYTRIKTEFCKIIDNYFTMYGYAVNEMKIPTVNNRQNYTYVKTIGCNLTANAPVDDTEKIKKCFDNGLTFWKYTAGTEFKMYDYSQSNATL